MHEICEEGSADLILKPGDKVENDYVVVAVKPDTVKIWLQKDCLGTMNWDDADSFARKYVDLWNKANSRLPAIDVSSELLSKEEAESISKSDRTTGFCYWTSTECSSGFHWFVRYDGSLNVYSDIGSMRCCQGIWVK